MLLSRLLPPWSPPRLMGAVVVDFLLATPSSFCSSFAVYAVRSPARIDFLFMSRSVPSPSPSVLPCYLFLPLLLTLRGLGPLLSRPDSTRLSSSSHPLLPHSFSHSTNQHAYHHRIIKFMLLLAHAYPLVHIIDITCLLRLAVPVLSLSPSPSLLHSVSFYPCLLEPHTPSRIIHQYHCLQTK